jgi:hypothetical protein
MDNSELDRLCRNDTHIAPYFLGVFPCDRLPYEIKTRPGCLIANTQPASQSGEHWVGIYFTADENVEYFCSFGLKPENRILHRYLQTHCKNGRMLCNKRHIQSSSSTTCGQHCVFYLHFRCRDVPMTSIVDLFSSNDIEFNDSMVTAFINGLYGA